MNGNRRISDDDSSFSSDSDSTSSGGQFSRSTDTNSPSRAALRRRDSTGLASMVGDWMGDERSVISSLEEEANRAPLPLLKNKKKKIVPRRSSSMASASSMGSDPIAEGDPSQRCYLVRGSETQGSLIEHYSHEPVNEFLAYWGAPMDKKIPNFKFTQNWGKNELVNSTQGDLRGKLAYFSGICQWLRKAKTFSATVRFNNHVPGWECDMYFYFLEPDDGVQTVLMKEGQLFEVSKIDGVAIITRGKDFLHYDPRFRCGIDKWVSEGSKLGFATKLDVRAGSAYPSSGGRKFGAAREKPQSIKENEEEKKEEEPKLRMVEGATVYIRDQFYSWIPATIESPEDDKKRVKVKVSLPRDWEEQTVKSTLRGSQNMK
eukprot:CAMPEP_0183720012 /NCGR_PEP_ID=MMETSP0737-20130205/12757_1 /TAXON_ID=385413 /ORGANISM="Thalassiosira miniscula, Strain CCMP1093" /LENGTH=373 /DNA_ID=CAMNT_0025949817 /DNA_START=122 /DNA_END=1240 /DNA_ORIENTATION=+